MPARRLALLTLSVLAACSSWPRDEPLTPADTGSQAAPVSSDSFDHGSWYSQTLRWQRDREEALRSETGYLALAGLWWLQPGRYAFGRDTASEIMLDDGPGQAGWLEVGADAIVLHAADGAEVLVDDLFVDEPVALRSDAHADGPSQVRVGRLVFWLIQRGDLLGLRLRDPQSPVLASYGGTRRWEPDERWRVPARLVPFDEPTSVEVPNVLGQLSAQATPGRLVFELDGVEHALTPTGEPGSDLFVVFADATTGESTYGGGRFLVVREPDVDGRTVLDFNRAYNPPCAYSPYTTCPLPPDGNTLPVAVVAGEQAVDDGPHG